MGTASNASVPLSHSEGPDHIAWQTNPDENPYYPAHFDGHGKCEGTITTTYNPSNLDYESSEESYIGHSHVHHHSLSLLSCAVMLAKSALCWPTFLVIGWCNPC